MDATRYVVDAKIPGSMVECGVWRGGSSMCMALAQLGNGRTPARCTYSGWKACRTPPMPTFDHFGRTASEMLLRERRLTMNERKQSALLAYSPLDEVRRNMESTHYPAHLIHYVRGRVEETIPSEAPANIALLRLDTDWYESTKHELLHLWPRVSLGRDRHHRRLPGIGADRGARPTNISGRSGCSDHAPPFGLHRPADTETHLDDIEAPAI